MAQKRYYFNPQSINLKPIQRSLKKWIFRILLFILICLILGIAGYFLVAGVIRTPREQNLLAQNERILDLYRSLNQQLAEYDHTLAEIRILDDSIYHSIIGGDPLPGSIRSAGTGGRDYSAFLRDGLYPELVIQTAERMNRLNSQLKIQENSCKTLLKEVYKNRNKMNHMPAIMPISNDDLKHTGAGFGMRRHPILNIVRMHEGIDFHAPYGSEVCATADGRIDDVRFSKMFGKVVEIDHGYGILTLYAHLSDFMVRRGQTVKRGQVIGLMGNTGLSSGVHLHYEVHLNGREVDPVNYFFSDLTPEEYRMIIAIAQAYETSMD